MNTPARNTKENNTHTHAPHEQVSISAIHTVEPLYSSSFQFSARCPDPAARLMFYGLHALLEVVHEIFNASIHHQQRGFWPTKRGIE